MGKYIPSYENIHVWESYSDNMGVELRQCMDEGLDIDRYKGLFKEVEAMPYGECKEKICDALFDMICDLPIKADYPYVEPNELDEIKAERDGFTLENYNVNEDTLEDKIKGAWFGRVIGCLLGKPVECIKYDELVYVLKATNNYPMSRYILNSDLTDEICNSVKFRLRNGCYIDLLNGMPADDDTNYVVMAQVIVESCSRDFTSRQVANAWMSLQHKDAYCTAERIAYKNYLLGYLPPDSGRYKNPYREWIGAQIRGDYFGYINPGNPELAAEMAYRDASFSHVKNGIYGEMFASAMIASAAVCNDVKAVILSGLSQIPKASRLYDSVKKIIGMYENNSTYDDCISYIHSIWDDKNSHDWCHTISNAMIVATALLYGQGDLGKSVCMAVQAAFDTDCNGATVGSIVGMMNGYNALDPVWVDPIKDTLHTSISGVGTVKVSDCAKKTMKHLAK